MVTSYVDQNRDALNPENTIFQEITGGLDQVVLGKRKVPSRAYVASFNFKGPDQEKKVANLSGGERNRVHLAKLLKSGGNLLLLDEPTNDLDVDMLRALEEALARLRRLRRGDQPRPLVPRPDRHPHPRLRGGQPGRLVRRQLPDLRGPAPRAARASTPTSRTGSATRRSPADDGRPIDDPGRRPPMARRAATQSGLELEVGASTTGVVRLTLNRPERRNALSRALLGRLEEALAGARGSTPRRGWSCIAARRAGLLLGARPAAR